MINESNGFNPENLMERVVKFTSDEKCHKLVEKTLKKYYDVNKITNSDATLRISESLGWVAEATKDPSHVMSVARCYLLEDVVDTVTKFKEDIADEVTTNICSAAETLPDQEAIREYVHWLNNGYISGLLGFAADFNNNGNLKLKKDIFNIISVSPKHLQDFNKYATIINGRRLNLEKKLEFYTLLKDIVNLEKGYYADILTKYGIKKLISAVERDLGDLAIGEDITSLKCGIKLVGDMKTNDSIRFLIDKHIAHGNVRKWMFKDDIAKAVIKELEDNEIDPNIYVASGRIVSQTRANGKFSENWTDVLKSLVVKIVGSRKKNLLPEVSIHSFSPRFIFKAIHKDYFAAIEGDREAGKRTLNKLRKIIDKAYESKKLNRQVKHISEDIDMLEKTIIYGGVLDYRGAKVVAKVWKRRIPTDFYDSELLRCCMYLPNGEMKYEIPLFMMDPKTTLVQYFIQGIDSPVAAATYYAGKVNDETVLMMDTWDAGGLVYAALGHDKMKDFVLESMRKFGKILGTNIIAFSKADYGRPEEFCNFIRGKELEMKNVYFEAIDVEDKVLKAYSAREKHHYTDAFGLAALKGNIKVFYL